MKIWLIEPFLEGSHQTWARGLQEHSEHEIRFLSLPGRHWKWRMHGGAVSLAEQFMQSDFQADLLLASDMLDLTTFLALTRKKSTGIPCAIYFHENQITYPWSPDDADVQLQRNNQYGFINYTSALAADALFFNSTYHLQSFNGALPDFLRQFPDHQELKNADLIRAKSKVLSLGLNLKKLDAFRLQKKEVVPIILWNHRWEYDKNPEAFFQALFQLAAEGIDFKVVVLGARYRQVPAIFKEAKTRLATQILHWGYADTFGEYASWLWQADLLPVTGNQDFFGGSVVEAIYCGVVPLLPQRLAYPEHLPPGEEAPFLYATEAEFYPRLKKWVEQLSNGEKHFAARENLQNFVSRYDWSTLAAQYDQAFHQLRLNSSNEADYY